MTRPTTTADTLRAAHLDMILDSYFSEASPAEILIDILTDAIHWCLLNDHEFDRLLATARMHIDFEVGPALSDSQRIDRPPCLAFVSPPWK